MAVEEKAASDRPVGAECFSHRVVIFNYCRRAAGYLQLIGQIGSVRLAPVLHCKAALKLGFWMGFVCR